MASPLPQRFQKAYVIGAGFSRSFGLPAVHELYQELRAECEADDCPLECRDLPTLLDRFSQAFPSIRRRGTQSGPDLIQLFTFTQIANGPLGKQVPDLSGLKPGEINRMCRVLLCRRLHRKARDAAETIARSRFLAELPGWSVFLDLNWDNLLEHGLYRAGRQFVYEDAEFHHREHQFFNFRPRTFVFKPHGSIDWFIRHEHERRPLETHFPLSYPVDRTTSVPPGYRIRKRHYLARWRSVEKPNEAAVWLRDATDPLMVTLGQGKLFEERPVPGAPGEDPFHRLRSMYGQACRLLSAAHEIIVIGYSLPEDDYEIYMLLQYALHLAESQHGQRPKVTVINPDEAVRCRYEVVGADVEFITACFGPDMAV